MKRRISEPNVNDHDADQCQKGEPLSGREIKRSCHEGSTVNGTNTSSNASNINNGNNQEQQLPDWSEQLHRSFASTIYDIGVMNSSPAVLLENMTKQDVNITSERIKSKLQKYRNNKDKSKQTFLEEYDAFLQKAHVMDEIATRRRQQSASTAVAVATPNHDGSSSTLPAAALLEMMGTQGQLLGGDVAAFLSFSVLKEDEIKRLKQRRRLQRNGASNRQQQQGIAAHQTNHINESYDLDDDEGDDDENTLWGNGNTSSSLHADTTTKQQLKRGALNYLEHFAGMGIPFPELTEKEKETSLGVSLTFVMGLFLSLTQHLVQGRTGDDQAPQQQPAQEPSLHPQQNLHPQHNGIIGGNNGAEPDQSTGHATSNNTAAPNADVASKIVGLMAASGAAGVPNLSPNMIMAMQGLSAFIPQQDPAAKRAFDMLSENTPTSSTTQHYNHEI